MSRERSHLHIDDQQRDGSLDKRGRIPGGAVLAPVFVWMAMRGSSTWRDFATATLVAAILANLPGITFWITMASGFRLHLVEVLIRRLGIVVVLVWIFFVATRLWRLASHEE